MSFPRSTHISPRNSRSAPHLSHSLHNWQDAALRRQQAPVLLEALMCFVLMRWEDGGREARLRDAGLARAPVQVRADADRARTFTGRRLRRLRRPNANRPSLTPPLSVDVLP
jgi:hypothetical protein